MIDNTFDSKGFTPSHDSSRSFAQPANQSTLRSFEAQLRSLNAPQRRAVETLCGPVLVIAGAGTGKTKVITTRLAHLLMQNFQAEGLVAVSFTNKASKEMKSRLEEIVGSKMAQRCQLSTFHSFSLQILRTHAPCLGISPSFRIADETQSGDLLLESLKELHLQEILPLSMASQKIAFCKDNLLTSVDLKSKVSVFEASMLSRLFDNYANRLRVFNLIDFDDIVYLSVLILKNNPAILEDLQKKYTHFMIDEFQDTSYSQFEFMRMLAGPQQNVCAVGDDDQSIYSWRGAKPSIVLDFLETFKNTVRVTLDQNYRCSEKILCVANSAIKNNSKRLEKSLWGTQKSEHGVKIYTAETPRDEAIWISNQMRSLKESSLASKEICWKDFTILVRSSSQIAPIEMLLSERSIPFKVNGGKKLFEKKEARDLLCYLNFAFNYNDLPSLLRIIKIRFPNCDLSMLQKISKQFLNCLSLDFPDAKFNTDKSDCNHKEFSFEDGNLTTEQNEFVKHFRTVCRSLSYATSKTEIVPILRNCFETMGLKEQIVKHSRDMKSSHFRLDLVQRFFEVLEKRAFEKLSIDSFLDSLSLEHNFDAPNENKDNVVNIMTIHASKGLEFPFVFVPGLEEGNLPHEKSSLTPEGVEEERRLFYVALTRAKYGLCLSHSEMHFKKKLGKSEYGQKRSRFLSEIDVNLLESTNDEADVDQRKIEISKKLFDLFR